MAYDRQDHLHSVTSESRQEKNGVEIESSLSLSVAPLLLLICKVPGPLPTHFLEPLYTLHIPIKKF